MKNLFYTIIIIFITSYSYSQKNSVCGKISYVEEFKNNNSQFNYTLFFNNDESLYIMENHNKDNDLIETVGGFVPPTITPIFYFNKKNNNLIFQSDVAFQKIITKDILSDLKWEIKKETKKIGKYNCIKATICFREINYIVWFTPEIPISYGPWKFRGLDGLIMEVYDENNNYHISIERIKITKDCILYDNKINKYKPLSPINWEDYLELKKEEEIEIENLFNSKLERGQSVGVTIGGFQREILK